MMFEMPYFYAVLPEIFVLSVTSVVLLFGLFVPESHQNKNFIYILAQIALVGAALLTLQLYEHQNVVTFNGFFVLDKIGNLLKLFIYLSGFAAFLYARQYLVRNLIPQLEYYILGLFAILGMMVLVSAHNFLTLYLGLELLSLPLYTLVALRRDRMVSTEAAMKYFVTGAIASGMLLYGLSMLYGVTGNLDISAVSTAMNSLSGQQHLILIFGLVFVVVGILFKLGGVPFHMWVPDVYDGAPTAAVVLLGTAPKIAALGMAIRLLSEAMPELHGQWHQLLVISAILSIAIGNVTALVQTHIKRLFAYSSIAHVGYMMLGLLVGTSGGYAAAMFYIIAYAMMVAAAFGILLLLGRKGFEIEKIEDLKGLNSRSPWLAFVMMVTVFSMAGVPPTMGFFAKMGVIQALVINGWIVLAVIALLFAVVGAYYYLRVIKVMYFDDADDMSLVIVPIDAKVLISINGLAILLLGLFPAGLIQLCQNAFVT